MARLYAHSDVGHGRVVRLGGLRSSLLLLHAEDVERVVETGRRLNKPLLSSTTRMGRGIVSKRSVTRPRPDSSKHSLRTVRNAAAASGVCSRSLGGYICIQIEYYSVPNRYTPHTPKGDLGSSFPRHFERVVGAIAGTHQTVDLRHATEQKLSVGRENPSAELLAPILQLHGCRMRKRAHDAQQY